MFGGRRETLETLSGVARPGGLVLVGEGYLRRPLTGAEEGEFGIGEDEMVDVAATIATGTGLGLEPLGSLLATEPEWDAYEDTYAGVDRALGRRGCGTRRSGPWTVPRARRVHA